jgi:signal transduction histidine kinase
MAEAAKSLMTRESRVRVAGPRSLLARPLEEAFPEVARVAANEALAAGIMHDFNNFMQLAVGSLEGMRSHMREGRISNASDRIETALRSLEGAAALAERLATFVVAHPPKPQPAGVNAVIRGIESLLRSALGRQIALELTLGRDLPLIRSDRLQLESALLNLAINSRDAMPNGGTLSIETSVTSVAYTASQRPYVSIRIADTGCGMTAATLARAPEPFYTTKPAGKGTGLGLPMVRRFVDEVGGRLEIESAVGRGTSVTLLLPCRYEVADSKYSAPAQAI